MYKKHTIPPLHPTFLALFPYLPTYIHCIYTIIYYIVGHFYISYIKMASLNYPSLPQHGFMTHQYAPLSAVHNNNHHQQSPGATHIHIPLNGQSNSNANGLPTTTSNSRTSIAGSTSPSSASVEPVTPPETSPGQPIEERRMSGSASTTAPVDDQIECKWADCDHISGSADDLYDHLCNNHVGRKSTGNLNLTCGWQGCGVKCVKRDHITSHLRGTLIPPLSFSTSSAIVLAFVSYNVVPIY